MEALLAQALGQDVTRLAIEEKRMLLSRLLARLAHEIRNPLSSLDIHVQLLDEDLSNAAPGIRNKVAGRLETIHGELHRLENIVKQFIRLAGPSALHLGPVEIGKIVLHVCGLLQPESIERQIKIEAQISEDVPSILADADQLVQALLNLVINALQAIGRNGRVGLAVRTDGSAVVIEVRDTGPGVPSDKLSAIFEPYYTTKPEGSGIGLWIAQQIVIAHGGTIQAANPSEGGALFTIRLPLRGNETSNGQSQS